MRKPNVAVSDSTLSLLRDYCSQNELGFDDVIGAAVESYIGGSASSMDEYSCWSNMRGRCRNENTPTWEHYGGRGISVTPRWDSFWMFLHDVGRRPTPEASLDRIDVDGNYEPGNVRWASKKEQSRNRRNNNVLSFNGEERCVTDWAEEYGIPLTTLKARLKNGWPVSDALTTPPAGRTKKVKFRGVEKSRTEWAAELGITPAALTSRLKRWSAKRALTTPPSTIKQRAGSLGGSS